MTKIQSTNSLEISMQLSFGYEMAIFEKIPKFYITIISIPAIISNINVANISNVANDKATGNYRYIQSISLIT